MPGDIKFFAPKKKAKIQPVESQMVVVQLKNPEGEALGPKINISSSTTTEQLQQLVDSLLESEESNSYSFFFENNEIIKTLQEDVLDALKYSPENIISIVYQPQSLFKVKPVTRCSSTLSGHKEAILCVCFSPDGNKLATGSGDCEVRVWDINTECPQFTLQGHSNWVQIVSWSPDSQILASGSMDNTIRLWNPKTGKALGDPLRSHTSSITAICWQPFKDNKLCNRFASSSRDGTVRIWDAVLRRVLMTISQHTAPVMCLRWGGEGALYTGSRDKTIKVWDAAEGKLIRTLEGHAHWVNHLALNTDFATRVGPFDHTRRKYDSPEHGQQLALEKYKELKGTNPEILVSCSDDFTIFLWNALVSKTPIIRLTGHQQLVNHVSFSPNGKWMASSSFDKSVKLWEGTTGKFISTLRGHVGAVYQVTFSPDSRLLLSASKDSTCKVWSLRTKKLTEDLPGHADEVFSVDWNPNGSGGASGGKDRTLKIWRN